jgi:glycosyltransferase involved in cell wall biosynthesis
LGRLISATRLALHIRRFPPDIVHVHYLRGLAWGMLLSRYHPYVATPWGSDVLDEQGAFRDWAGRILTTGVLNQADLVTAHSQYLESRVKGLLRGSTPIAHIGWGVDLALFRPGIDTVRLRQRWHIGPDQQVILSPRLAQPFYRHEIIIEAFKDVREKFPGAILVITEQFADRRYVEQLRRLVDELGLGPAVRFVGSISYEEMPQWLNLAKIVVMVPRSDGMPNTLLEAMACGAFPVLNRLPQYEGVIKSGWNGLLVDLLAGSLSDAMQEVLRSAALGREAARRNRNLVEAIGNQDHEMERMVHWYDQLRLRAA